MLTSGFDNKRGGGLSETGGSDYADCMQSKTRIRHPNPEPQKENVTWRSTDRKMNYATLILYINKKIFWSLETDVGYYPREKRRQDSSKHQSVQFSSVAQSCPTLCDPMNCNTQGLPVHHQLPEFTHTHVHRVGDAIQPSHPLLSPSPPAPNPSQHQGLFQ